MASCLIVSAIGNIVGQTMTECEMHGHTNFIFVERKEGVFKVCERCELENELFEDEKN